MGPKKADNTNKLRRPSQPNIGTTEDQENQQCVGKFAADLELCCRELTSGYPVNIPVHIRGHPPLSQQVGTHSRGSITPSVAGGNTEEPIPVIVKRPSRGRIPSISHNSNLIGVDTDSHHELFKSPYKTFHIVRDTDYFRPKLLIDSNNNENESIDQINVLYMKAWRLDQRFIDILKKILPLQEYLHTLNFCFVGLNEQTIVGLADVCSLIKNLKTLSLDGNPFASEHFHILIQRDDLKIAHLSLRYCKITDASAERLANILGNMSTQNWKLLTLTLSGNQIGDNGAKSFAKALRFNRTLISLNLSSNFITDKGACALALVLRKIVLTQEEIIHRRYLLAERYAETHLDDMRNNATSPTLSTGSGRSKLGGAGRRISDTTKRRKSISTKNTDKRNRCGSGDENRPPSASKGDLKKGKTDGRTAAVNPRHPTTDQPRASAGVRGKKSTAGGAPASKKNITIVKEEDEYTIDEDHPSAPSVPGKYIALIDRENPLLEPNENDSRNGEISLKGNLILLNLNLSRNYLTINTVNEFFLSIQYQTALTYSNDAASISSTTASLIEFSGLCRLELKGMNDVSIKSPIYQSLQALLIQKNPSIRFQQFKEREAKELLDQQSSVQVSQPIIPEKTRAASSVKSLNQRPTSRMKD